MHIYRSRRNPNVRYASKRDCASTAPRIKLKIGIAKNHITTFKLPPGGTKLRPVLEKRFSLQKKTLLFKENIHTKQINMNAAKSLKQNTAKYEQQIVETSLVSTLHHTFKQTSVHIYNIEHAVP